jgi:hypothetical protein
LIFLKQQNVARILTKREKAFLLASSISSWKVNLIRKYPSNSNWLTWIHI